jgi:hypothetical protein
MLFSLGLGLAHDPDNRAVHIAWPPAAKQFWNSTQGEECSPYPLEPYALLYLLSISRISSVV